MDKWPAYARLLAVASAGHLPTAATPRPGTRPCPNCDLAKRAELIKQARVLWPTGHRLHCNFYDDPAEGLRSSLHGSPVFRCRRPMPWITSLPGAAKRYGAAIDPELPDRLMEKAPEADALPLLAFAMQRLWDRFGVRGSLRQADYRAMGGLFGLMGDAAERALYGIRPESVDEALFREWPRFWQWLEPERERLEALGGLQISVFNWMRHGGKSIF